MPPGKEGKISLSVPHTEGLAGEVAKGATVTTNDPEHATFVLTLRARFKYEPPPTPPGATPAPEPGRHLGPLSLSPTDRWITSILKGTPSSGTIHIYNNDSNPIKVKSATVSGNEFTAKLTTIEEGKRYELFVSTNAALKPGQYHQTVKLTTDSKEVPEVIIQLDATVYSHVFTTPTSIILPLMPTTIEASAVNLPFINIRKIRDGGLQIKKVSSTLPFIQPTLVTDVEGQVYKVTLTFKKTKGMEKGTYKGKIMIETNDPDSPMIEVPIQGEFN
ncbi:MAG: hypothetical protein AB1757_26095 [Acidobacteriota bacterium]